MKNKMILMILNCIIISSLFIGCNSKTDTSTNNTTEKPQSAQNAADDNNKKDENTDNKDSHNQIKLNNEKKKIYLNSYLTELEQLENNDIQTNRQSFSTVEISQYASEFLKKYDDMLNRIYGSLKEVLTEDEFKTLEADELKWIKQKEDALNKVAEEAKGGGTMYAYAGSLTALDYTHERIYELLKYLGNVELNSKDEAYDYLLQQDGLYIDKELSANSALSYSKITDLSELGNSFIIMGGIKEDFYVFTIENTDNTAPFQYYVGKTSKKIYLTPNQGGMALLQIKNGTVVNHFDRITLDNCAVWR